MTEEEGEPISADAASAADEPRTCANCGERVDTDEWHPVSAEYGPDGEFRVYAFCGEDCRAEWGESR